MEQNDNITLEDLVNDFVFRSTVRAAIINREIQKIQEEPEQQEQLYNEICGVILRHADDIRVVAETINRLSISDRQKDSLQQTLKMISLESIIYNMGHTLREIKGLEMSSNINTCFIRRTKKFWVLPENVETILSMIIPHLPVYIFGDDGSGRISSTISSVYFDTSDFYLYQQRIKREQGAKALRIRKYGESSIIGYVELKTHEDGWTGEKSTKKRFMIHTKCIQKLAQGIDIWEDIKSINTSEDSYNLYLEVLQLIKDLQLIPVVKTLYTRTAFQFPGSAAIRISVDTKLSMWNGETGKAFPYAILEVKLEEGTEADWLAKITESSLVIPVDKFSKYLHACSVHYQEIPSIPYWYNQMPLMESSPVRLTHPQHNHTAFFKVNDEVSSLIQALESQVQPATNEYSPIAIPNKDNLIQNSHPVNNTQQMNEQPSRQKSQFFEAAPLRQPQSAAVPSEASDKPVIVPVRIEPKVFFANERTFLSWLHFAIFIGGIGAALMGLGDMQAALSGVCFIVVSIIFSIYALYLYIWRAKRIREKNPGPYDDHNGPVILVAVFLSAMVTSIFFKFPLK